MCLLFQEEVSKILAQKLKQSLRKSGSLELSQSGKLSFQIKCEPLNLKSNLFLQFHHDLGPVPCLVSFLHLLLLAATHRSETTDIIAAQCLLTRVTAFSFHLTI